MAGQVPLPVADHPCVSVCPWAAYLPTASVPGSLQEKKVKLKDPKKRGNRRMARNGKEGLGRKGRPTLINPGSLLAFRTGAELTPPPGLTAPGHGPIIPSRTESGMSSQPLQAGSQACHSSPGSQPRSHSSLSIPQSLPGSHVLGPLWLTCSDLIPSHLGPLQENYASCLGSRSLHFLLLQMGKLAQRGAEYYSRSHSKAKAEPG